MSGLPLPLPLNEPLVLVLSWFSFDMVDDAASFEKNGPDVGHCEFGVLYDRYDRSWLPFKMSFF